jgi:hypothetical protein
MAEEKQVKETKERQSRSNQGEIMVYGIIHYAAMK